MAHAFVSKSIANTTGFAAYYRGIPPEATIYTKHAAPGPERPDYASPPPAAAKIPTFEPRDSTTYRLAAPDGIPISLAKREVSTHEPTVSDGTNFRSQIIESEDPIIPTLRKSATDSPLDV